MVFQWILPSKMDDGEGKKLSHTQVQTVSVNTDDGSTAFVLEEGSETEVVLVQMINSVFETHRDVSKRLELRSFLEFTRVMSLKTRRRVAAMLLESISEYKYV